MGKKRMTTREKLLLMKQMKERNEQRRKEFVAKNEQETTEFERYINGESTKEELLKRITE